MRKLQKQALVKMSLGFMYDVCFAQGADRKDAGWIKSHNKTKEN